MNNMIVGATRINQKLREGFPKTPLNRQTNFNNVLNGLLNEADALQFSKHAQLRINSRDISLSSDQLRRVESGVVRASQKGINHSLVLVDDVALLVNIPSKMVVTAINQDSQNIFTNIDGAVIV